MRVDSIISCVHNIRDLWYSLAMFTSLEVEIEKEICIELIQNFDVFLGNMVERHRGKNLEIARE